MEKFAASVVDTGGKFAAISLTPAAILPPVSFETVLVEYSGAVRKVIHEKTRGKKSRDTVPLKHSYSSLPECSSRSLLKRSYQLTDEEGVVVDTCGNAHAS